MERVGGAAVARVAPHPLADSAAKISQPVDPRNARAGHEESCRTNPDPRSYRGQLAPGAPPR
jgi:hypothetical protein